MMSKRIMIAWLACASLLTAALPAAAAPHEARVPVREGRVELRALWGAISKELKLPACDVACGSIDVSGVRGSTYVQALNQALGEGLRVSAADDALVLHVDPEKIPTECAAMSRAVRVFAAVASPEATAAQAGFYGMSLPERVDPAKPIVVLVHGLDCDRTNWHPLSGRLTNEGYQLAYFTYPSDQPIAESAAFFGKHMALLRSAFPAARVDVVAHSMGGLVSRAYVEGPTYDGGVSHLIMMGTPNGGSTWSKYRIALELQEHYHLWRNEPRWHWTWMLTDGLGEAGYDLKPGSPFLTELNARPRRAGVKYTLIAGSQHPASRIKANVAESTAGAIPSRAAKWWGFRHCKDKLDGYAERRRHDTGDSDGPVKIESVKLSGVDDFVVIPADHATLYCDAGDKAPAAWDTIRDRLAR